MRARASGRVTSLGTCGVRFGRVACLHEPHVAHALGEGVGRFVQESEKIALAAVLFPEVEGDEDSREQRRANHSQLQLLGGRASFVSEQRCKELDAMALRIEEARAKVRNRER
jgi:hypothetical protein